MRCCLKSLSAETDADGKSVSYISGNKQVISKLSLPDSYVYASDPFGAATTPVIAAVKSLDEIRTSYYDADGRMMSIAHRGDWREYPENSLAAIQACIDAGIDIVEIDLRKTRDGVWGLCHDETVNRTTNGSGSVADLTYEQIQKLNLKPGKGGGVSVTEYKMPTFDEVLELCRGKILLNLDKGYESRDEIYAIAEKYGCLDICMFKGGTIASWAAELKKVGKTMPLICGSYWSDDLNGFNSYIDALSGLGESIESGFKTLGQAQSKKSVWTHAKAVGIRGVMLTLSASYSGGLADDQTGWAALWDMGVSVIMTEYPKNLAAYIENISSVREALTPIRAENFNSCDGITLSGAGNVRDNRIIKSIVPGGFAAYRNIDFGDGVGTIVVKAKGLAAGASVAVRFDSPDGEVAALITVGEDDDYVCYAADFAKISGTHDVYLSFEGNGSALMSVDSIVFAK